MRVDPAGAELGWYDERLGGSGSSAACCGPRPGAANLKKKKKNLT